MAWQPDNVQPYPQGIQLTLLGPQMTSMQQTAVSNHFQHHKTSRRDKTQMRLQITNSFLGPTRINQTSREANRKPDYTKRKPS
jgi:hypothetical protein